MLDFVSAFRSVIIATTDANGYPFNSYAPFVFFDNRYFVFISDIAKHATNLQREKRASLLFIEDENGAENLHARKRVSVQCDAAVIHREDALYAQVMPLFSDRFDAKLMDMLQTMNDFNLHMFMPVGGEAVFGFGEAYTLGGEHMQTLLPRSGPGHHKKT